jgi:heme-degrading monooxygenase HmoA
MLAMVTIVTHVVISEGQEPEWDGALRERVGAAHEQPGFVAVQVAIPLDSPNERVIIGTWETRADWEAWHAEERFLETRAKLEQVDETKTNEWWHEVLLEEHR